VRMLDPRRAGTEFSVATTAFDAATFGVVVRGDVDPVTAPELEQELLATAPLGARRVVVDPHDRPGRQPAWLEALSVG